MPRRRRRANVGTNLQFAQNPSSSLQAHALMVAPKLRAREGRCAFRRSGSGAIWFRLERVERTGFWLTVRDR
jgi:hypothetical protein